MVILVPLQDQIESLVESTEATLLTWHQSVGSFQILRSSILANTLYSLDFPDVVEAFLDDLDNRQLLFFPFRELAELFPLRFNQGQQVLEKSLEVAHEGFELTLASADFDLSRITAVNREFMAQALALRGECVDDLVAICTRCPMARQLSAALEISCPLLP